MAACFLLDRVSSGALFFLEHCSFGFFFFSSIFCNSDGKRVRLSSRRRISRRLYSNEHKDISTSCVFLDTPGQPVVYMLAPLRLSRSRILEQCNSLGQGLGKLSPWTNGPHTSRTPSSPPSHYRRHPDILFMHFLLNIHGLSLSLSLLSFSETHTYSEYIGTSL